MDLTTDKQKINELKGTIARLESEKEKTLAWVKEKEKQCDEYEARATKAREEIIKKSHDLTEQEKALNKLKHETAQETQKLTKLRTEANQENGKLEAAIQESKSRAEVARLKIEELEKKEIEVNRKLAWWASVKDQLLKMK